MARTTEPLSGGITVSRTAEEAGARAADLIAERIVAAIASRGEARLVLASAPSQETMLAALRADDSVDWGRVRVYHMDEYLGLAPDRPQSFGQWLADRLPGEAILERIDTSATDPAVEIARYSGMLAEAPIDVTCLGIGMNGHIAFNEPGVADLEDAELVRLISLDEISRRQQVEEGLFPRLEEVPTRALTLTVPTLAGARSMVATVLGRHKAPAVVRALTDPVGPGCPATVLRTHLDASLHLDPEAASLVAGREGSARETGAAPREAM